MDIHELGSEGETDPLVTDLIIKGNILNTY